MTAEAPDIPDHEIIRRIGKGSYGEVWLGRSVTGALRAVKVVSRANFELDRTFEREFEGIKSFEKVSLKHPGLVNILHVGRNNKEGFYYYVMELADDRAGGRDIDSEQYVQHTLSSEINKRGRLPMDLCATWGAVLASALDHMHCSGLAHRDVKPSNVVFFDGIPKLADMGLVAASGQKTFVGTEGFSPPEGPGEPAADIYSLGMVLYEMSSGHDRLDFPEISELKRDKVERRKWKRINTIVCKACAPLAKNRYGSAREMRQALDASCSGIAVPLSLPANLFRIALFSGILALIAFVGRNYDLIKGYYTAGKAVQQLIAVDNESKDAVTQPVIQPVTRPPAEKFGSVKIKSSPTGAKVYQIIEGGGREFRGYTSPDYVEAEVLPGEVSFIIELADYRYSEVSGFVVAGETLNLDAGELEFYSPPIPGNEWRNSMGMLFEPDIQNRHVARRPFTPKEFEPFLNAHQGTVDFRRVAVTLEGEEDSCQTVMVSRKTARDFFEWLTAQEKRSGHLDEDHYYVLNNDVVYRQDDGFTGSEIKGDDFALFSSVEEVNFSSLLISSEPPGADVYIDGEFIGTTGTEIPKRYPGVIEVVIRLAGFKQELATIELDPGKAHKLAVTLREDNSVVFNRKWLNGMGMALLPLGEGVMMAEHETRVQDFDAYCKYEEINSLPRPDFNQEATHPVVKVSRKDAMAFCEWLSLKERQEELIDADHEYRLPTDREWSIAAGLGREQGEAPWQRDLSIKGVFPWGDQWPPPAGSANIADRAARQWLKEEGRILPGFNDKFASTAPVGSFKPSAKGYFDLAGNVWEWVLDPYGGREGNKYKDWWVARGGGFDAAGKDLFLSSYRNLQPPDTRATTIGFRIVLAIKGIRLKD